MVIWMKVFFHSSADLRRRFQRRGWGRMPFFSNLSRKPRQRDEKGYFAGMIYLDASATTPVHPEVVDAMLPYLREHWQNPSSGYRAAKKVREAVEEAREEVAALIHSRPEEVVFTSGGTESNNMALKSLAKTMGRKSVLVTTMIEHSAVLRPLEAFEKVGFEVRRAPVTEGGRVDLAEYEKQLSGAQWVSAMWVNNETGVIQPLSEMVTLAKQQGAVFHTDAIQAAGKIAVDVSLVPVDFLSLSAHKFHGPKGVGALFVREGMECKPLLHGGGQEQGYRSGTENVSAIVGMGVAARMARRELVEKQARVAQYRDLLASLLLAELKGVTLNGDLSHRTAGVLHLSFESCEAAGLLILLDEFGVQCSAGSACMTGKQQPSHVQKAMGFSDAKAKSSLRISLSTFTTEEEVRAAAKAIQKAVTRLRSVQGEGGVGPVVVYS